jgi:hypothetical protein
MNAIQHVTIELAIPTDLERFTLPEGVNRRLQDLLDRQDRGETLSASERMEAEGLVNLAELLSLLRLRTTRIAF